MAEIIKETITTREDDPNTVTTTPVKRGASNFQTVEYLIYFLFGILEIIFLLAIIFARSYGALIGVIVTGIILSIVSKKLRWIGIGATIAGVLLVAFIPAVRNKVLFQGTSGQIRQYVYGETLSMLKDHPWQGGGLARYQKSILPYHKVGYLVDGKWQPIEIYLYPHNIFLNFWSELGILGLIGFLTFFGVLIYVIKQKNFDENQGLFKSLVVASFLVIIIHGLVDVPYFKNDLSVMWWAIVILL